MSSKEKQMTVKVKVCAGTYKNKPVTNEEFDYFSSEVKTSTAGEHIGEKYVRVRPKLGYGNLKSNNIRIFIRNESDFVLVDSTEVDPGLSIDTTKVPRNLSNAVRNMYQIEKASTFGELMKTEKYGVLKSKYIQSCKKDSNLSTINLNIIESELETISLLDVKLDYVIQRNRFNKTHMNNIITTAKTFNVKHARIPTFMRCEDGELYCVDWQKRTLALLLRGITEYPAIIMQSTTKELSEDFGSQFALTDKISDFDQFKAKLQSPNKGIRRKAWHQQNSVDYVGVTFDPSYPGNKPLLTPFNHARKAMEDSVINKNELGERHKTHINFRRAVNVYKNVWPQAWEDNAKVDASLVRTLTCVIASFDAELLKGNNSILIKMLEILRDQPKPFNDYKEIAPNGLQFPSSYTSNLNKFDLNTDGLKYRNSILIFAKLWNLVRKKNKGFRELTTGIDADIVHMFENSKADKNKRKNFIVMRAEA